ncbi:hypothetical protein ACIA59_22075 [Micromonospora haikouensis]|uniref:hypothetical protein n=1 Tax=Micromonospora haikouensis TaxID=686309 RepID=UPI00378F6B96
MVVPGGPQGYAPLSAGARPGAAGARPGSAAATAVAVVAVVLLVVLALIVALVGMFLPMAADACGTEGTEGLMICGPAGELAVLAPAGGAVLGVLVALAGFVPLPLRHRRLVFIGLGYLLVLGGLGIGFLVAFSGW